MKLAEHIPFTIKRSRVAFKRLLAFVLVFVLFALPAETIFAVSETTLTPAPTAAADPDMPFNWSFLNMSLNSDSAFIMEMDHGIRLYEKQPALSQAMPLVNHLMTAILALEYLDERTIITLSQEAAILADDTSTFVAGRRYPVEYLLLALLLDDSPAAAFALAEEISGSEESFVATMNNRATSLGMSATLFTNATGHHDVNQYTNTKDLMTLLRFALRSDSFLDFFGQRDNMYSLPDGSRHYFSNDFISAWSFSENTVEGAALSSYDDRYTAALLLTDEIKDITYAVIMTGPYTESSFTNNRQLIADLQSISGRISAGYESSQLAQRGAVFQQDYEIAGQTVNLVYSESVSYTHPIGDSFQASVNAVMNPDEMTLPLSTSDVIGYVEFRLSEGSTIRVNLSSDTVILAQNDTLNYILSIINANQELVTFILVLMGIFILILLWQITRVIIRVSYIAWLKRQRGSLNTAAGTSISSGEGLVKSQSLANALRHSLRSDSGTVPKRIAQRYRKAKNLPETTSGESVTNEDDAS